MENSSRVLSLIGGGESEVCSKAVSFDDFWVLYPRHEAKKVARRVWDRMSERDRVAACVALVEWRRVFMLRELQFIPLASTWLNGERWEDELPAGHVRVSLAQAHQAFARVEEKVERVPMPEKLRVELERLRRKG